MGTYPWTKSEELSRDGKLDPLTELDWPPWAPVLSCAISLAGAAISMGLALHQRFQMESNGYNVAPAVIAAAFVALPFLLDLIDFFVPFRTALPLWLFPIPVFLGTSYLVWHPSDVDVAPFTLVFMAAEMAARSEKKP